MNKKDKIACRRMIGDLLKTFNFKYLWISKNTAIKKCMEFIINECNRLNNKDYTLILAKYFFININNAHFKLCRT